MTTAPVQLVGVVDFDPSGDEIAKVFRKQLEAAGLDVASLKTVIDPRHFSAEEVAIFRFPLLKKQPTKTAGLLERTAGSSRCLGRE